MSGNRKDQTEIRMRKGINDVHPPPPPPPPQGIKSLIDSVDKQEALRCYAYSVIITET